MKILLLILVVFLPVFEFVNAQERFPKQAKAFDKAMYFSEMGNYVDAINVFKVIVEENPKHLDALFNMGLCYLNTSNGADTAVICFNQALSYLSDDEKSTYVENELLMSLGTAYQVLLKPDSAIEIYKKLLKKNGDADLELKKRLSREIEVCHNAELLINNPVDITIENMGSSVNSMYDDHSPLVSVNENQLYFTSRRSWIKQVVLEDGQYAEKIYTAPLSSRNWESAKLLNVFFSNNEHEAASCISPDGTELILFRNDEHGKSLYSSSFDGNSWSEPVKFPEPINSFSQETHGSMSADKSTLFFTSDREGGFGGLDIYVSKRNADGTWGLPKNLGPSINTEYDEETPMIHYDGKTLYFSSEGHNSMGRLDVFYSQMTPDSTWSLPVNMGYPINTPDDDFFFVPTINKTHAYYASSKFEDNYGGSDIYLVRFENYSEGDLAVVEGKVSNDSGVSYDQMRVLVTRKRDNALVGDYRPNANTGKYMMFLEVGNEYKIQEATPVGPTESTSYIEVGKEMAYSKREAQVVFEEVEIDAPLTPYGKNTAFYVQEELKQEVDDSVLIEKTKLSSNDTEGAVGDEFVKESVTKNKISPKAQVDNYAFRDGYTVQLLALKEKPLNSLAYFRERGLSDISEYRCRDGYTRYAYGVYERFSDIKKIKKQLIESGMFQDVWIRPIKEIDSLVVTTEN